MKKTTASYTLLVSLILILASHFEIQVIDGKRIVVLDSVYFDLQGYFQEKTTDMINLTTAQCNTVEYLSKSDLDYAKTLSAVQGYSPPDSKSAKIVQLARDGEWLWAEVSFIQLEPVVVLLKHNPNGLTIWDGSIWSGPTYPWRVKNTIEKYLKTKSPQASHRLLECVAPSPGVFTKR
jgi:hypothetical protein